MQSTARHVHVRKAVIPESELLFFGNSVLTKQRAGPALLGRETKPEFTFVKEDKMDYSTGRKQEYRDQSTEEGKPA